MHAYPRSVCIDTTLHIAQQKSATRVMIREMAESLHAVGPGVRGRRHPACIRVELPEVLNERFDQDFLTVGIFPDLGRVEGDGLIDLICVLPSIENRLSLRNDIQFFSKISILVHRSIAECFCDASLPFPRTSCVTAHPDIFEIPAREYSVFKSGCCRSVPAGSRHLEGEIRKYSTVRRDPPSKQSMLLVSRFPADGARWAEGG